MKNNNSAADLHNLKKNLETDKRKDYTVYNSVFINSPKNEPNHTISRTNSNLKRIPPNLSNSKYEYFNIN